MKAVINLFWQICLMRQSPGSVPTQSWFVAAVLLANAAASIALSLALGSGEHPVSVAAEVAAGLAASGLLVFLACYLREVPGRFTATFTAILGCDLIITALYAMLLPLAQLFGVAAASVALLVFIVWSVSVVGFILHRALNTHLAVGVITAFGISLISASAGQVATAP
jgi:hypothetical protein